MDTLIALSGIANSGKTETIKLVFETLKSFPGVQIIQKDLQNDIFIILMYKKNKLGITSQGDNRIFLDDKFEIFQNEKCNIVICATRTRGGTCDAVNEMADKYVIQWVNKSEYYSGVKEKQKEMNKQAAAVILNLIKWL